ncbi:integral membrane protein [Kwoniella heveanensis BCC8398]|uniref:Glycerophosphocholine acyltransferase 1 n=1 Tax=Kwoniella heveanensis BCC8398 TaxID=1296120 RepID=A0A1B9GZB5_9TREE|nr:integral membrane protein [Kwoniella heveanensis BCC8398]
MSSDRPSSPPSSATGAGSGSGSASYPQRESLSRNSSFSNIMTLTSFDRYSEDWAGALTLLDVIETFFDSRLDLFNRRLKAQSNRIKSRAVELLPKGLRTPKGGGILLVEDEDEYADVTGTGEGGGMRQRRRTSDKDRVGDKYRKEVEREVERIKVKLAAKVTHLSGTWRSEQVVRTKDKISFLFGVLSLAFTCILYGAAPEWIPFAYTVQSSVYLPLRFWQYKRKAWHYFLFGGLCYFVNILDLLWLWVFPSSTVLFICCYLLTLGPIASAIITWRNSLVFHSLDKMISIFIHIYPPIVLTVIRHLDPNAEQRYPGLKHVNDYKWYTMILLSGVPYILWQAAYYKFISLDRKSKIESGQRQNSFHYMLNDKRGPIGKALQGIRPEHRELWFIFGQLIYSIVFMIPPAALLINSRRASSAFLIIIFAVSAWNGASFYVEVFGRKFERELEKLRKEMELASATGVSLSASSNATSASTNPSSPPSPYPYTDADNGQSPGQRDGADAGRADRDDLADSPLMLPSTKASGDRNGVGMGMGMGSGGMKRVEEAEEMEVPDLALDRAAEEVQSEVDDGRQR